MTHTHQYELMVILNPEIDERQVAPNLEKFLKVITNDGGSIDNVDIWGRRRLAYEIQKNTEGIYAVVNFTSTSAAAQELDRQLKLDERVMRTKVLRAEEAMAQVAAEQKRYARVVVLETLVRRLEEGMERAGFKVPKPLA